LRITPPGLGIEVRDIMRAKVADLVSRLPTKSDFGRFLPVTQDRDYRNFAELRSRGHALGTPRKRLSATCQETYPLYDMAWRITDLEAKKLVEETGMEIEELAEALGDKLTALEDEIRAELAARRSNAA
jgi:hypothetical protein